MTWDDNLSPLGQKDHTPRAGATALMDGTLILMIISRLLGRFMGRLINMLMSMLIDMDWYLPLSCLASALLELKLELEPKLWVKHKPELDEF